MAEAVDLAAGAGPVVGFDDAGRGPTVPEGTTLAPAGATLATKGAALATEAAALAAAGATLATEVATLAPEGTTLATEEAILAAAGATLVPTGTLHARTAPRVAGGAPPDLYATKSAATFSELRSARGRFVNTSQPVRVTTRVCSNCAEREPSAVRTVHLSVGSTTTS